jgi:aspartate aminotransferase
VSQAAALAALNGPMDFLEGWRAAYAERRDLVVGRLNAIEGLHCPTPQGAFYVYPSCAGLIGKRTPDGRTIEDDNALVLYLLDAQGVGTVQGAAFGLSPAFRISFATSTAELTEGCDRIARACAELA